MAIISIMIYDLLQWPIFVLKTDTIVLIKYNKLYTLDIIICMTHWMHISMRGICSKPKTLE